MVRPAGNPLAALVDRQGFAVLDGGLATTLESHGHDLDDDLWSARLLLEEPGAVEGVHREFLEAGADVLITASYQASVEGFARRGIGHDEARELLESSVDLALRARAAADEPTILVAASVGPYGAALADGSEYTGRYDLDDAGLRRFHADRWSLLAGTPADLLACETIPSLRETAVLLDLLAITPDTWAWFSFSCRDGKHLNDGNPIADAARLCASTDRVAAVGINCTAPRHGESLIGEVRRVWDGPVVIYPNSGEVYDTVGKTWADAPDSEPWSERVERWYAAGARIIGGCCRVGPDLIAESRRTLERLSGS